VGTFHFAWFRSGKGCLKGLVHKIELRYFEFFQE
jgi:hypothetical protein